jgi:hypothetical protein
MAVGTSRFEVQQHNTQHNRGQNSTWHSAAEVQAAQQTAQQGLHMTPGVGIKRAQGLDYARGPRLKDAKQVESRPGQGTGAKEVRVRPHLFPSPPVLHSPPGQSGRLHHAPPAWQQGARAVVMVRRGGEKDTISWPLNNSTHTDSTHQTPAPEQRSLSLACACDACTSKIWSGPHQPLHSLK